MRRSWLLLAILLAGCQTAPVRLPTGEPWPQRKAELQQRSHYVVKGRVAVAAGGEGFNARLRWVQDGPQAQLSLEGPLGAGGVQITAKGEDLSIVTSGGEHLGSEAARAELASHLGFQPPIGSLRYWMLGVPDPDHPAQETVDDGQRLIHLAQAGWEIEYPAYMPVDGQSLPSRVTLHSSDVRVRVLVDSWSP